MTPYCIVVSGRAAISYLPVTRVFCDSIDINAKRLGTVMVQAGLLGGTCFVGGIRDPDFKPYRIIIVSPGLFEIPSWQLCFATLLAKILRGVWGNPVSNDTNSSDEACSMNQKHLPTLALRFPKELLSRRCQPHIHNIDPKPHKWKQAYMPLRCAGALAQRPGLRHTSLHRRC